MPHEYFRYAVAGATFLGMAAVIIVILERDWLGDVFGTPSAAAGTLAATVIVGWWLYNAFRFLWALQGDFERTHAMRRIRTRLIAAIAPPRSPYEKDPPAEYEIDFSKVIFNPKDVSDGLEKTPIRLSCEEFITLFDPYRMLRRIPFSYRGRVAQGLDWLFVEHINHLYFFRDASAEYTRGFASSFQGYFVTPIAIVYGALAGGFVVSWLNWGDWQSSVVSAVFGLISLLLFLMSGVYGLCICKKENEARLMLTSILMVPQIAQ